MLQRLADAAQELLDGKGWHLGEQLVDLAEQVVEVDHELWRFILKILVVIFVLEVHSIICVLV